MIEAQEMNSLKKYIALAIAMVVPFALVANANAAGESVTATTKIEGIGGKLYKEAQVSSKLNIHAEVTTPSSSPTVLPMKNVKVTFPAGMTFKPNDSKTPVCTDSKLSASSNLSDPAGVADACKSSVIGTGTAAIYLAKVNVPSALITDPILIAFNAGKTSSGQAKMKIYGYSDRTHVGILMNGTLNGSVLNIAIPVLSSDSAVKYFDLNFPGDTLSRPELGVNVRGLDQNYVQAKCSSSPLKTNAVFELGERTYPGGQDVGPTTEVKSPQTTQPCTGVAGNAKLGGVKVKGPNAVKNGRKGAFKVTVKNNGTATAKNVVVTSNRGGKGKAGNIAPGKSKTVTVKVKIKGKKGKKVAVKFTAKSGKVKAGATKKVKVK
jgi:hypothetical protein